MAGRDEPRRRNTLRIPQYDYAEPGAYFVTICCQDRACLLGSVANGEFRPSDAGRMVDETWREMPTEYPGVGLDAFVVMPKHVHGVIFLEAALSESAETAPRRMSLSAVIQRFKSLTTARYGEGVRGAGWPSFAGRLWQRGFYDHVIREDRGLHAIRDYILGNPAQWAEDPENPTRPPARTGRTRGSAPTS